MTLLPVQARITRHFDNTAERVFDAWLDCDLIGVWMFGPFVRDEEIIHLSRDPRVGGAFSFLVERGDDAVEHAGRYLELSRPRRLAFSWFVADEPVGSRIVVDIVPAEGACDVTVTQELHPACAGQIPSAEEDWRRKLEALAAALRERP